MDKMEDAEPKYSRIESKEIRGLNIRNLVAIVIATIGIVTTILLKTSSLEGQLRDIRTNQVNTDKIYDMRFQNMQQQVDEVDKKLEKLLNNQK